VRDGVWNRAQRDGQPRRNLIYRWQIQFRARKLVNTLGKALNRRSGEHHLMAVILVAMINHLVGMRMARVLGGKKEVEALSYEKLYDALAIHHQAAKRWEGILIFALFMQHVERDKRRRKSPVTTRALGIG